MSIVNISKAETELSKLLDRVEAGEEVVIARDDKPVAKLVLVESVDRPPRQAGRFAHLRDKLPENLFLEPLSEDELQAWEGKYSHPADNGQ
ncbi:type II toxin-antitoxin system prevent-host-death family antitoxin [Aliirhizobium terrae]|uniref:type II toxin-antitoxin system Phd/YefM family antitoxin n=1 Tax=Terrirhizobium terrae TaxID=2926709 RepID=UPI002576F03E|nr:type II toxin-antitoxin system prevent-host-death family antitoxin [Rhizobium sp. CC-CFT758]WJH39944.1 type II toxin-antitoxin system prevent-host-death family antitoxin [Rhizobium sp. CC-CFT758]